MMSTIRVPKRRNPFAQIDRRALEDEGLSWKAKGLLAYLLSRPDDWQVYVEQLKTVGPDGRDATRSGLSELEDAGYVDKKQRHNDDTGHFEGYEYLVYEHPSQRPDPADGGDDAAVNGFSEDGSTVDGFSENGFSENGLSEIGKPTTTNKDSTNKEDTNKENTAHEDHRAPAREPEGVEQVEPSAFLDEDDAIYAPDVEDLAQEYSGPINLPELMRRCWGGYRSGQLPTKTLDALCQREQQQHGPAEGWVRFVAGAVITRENADQPNAKYLSKVLQNLDTDRHDNRDRSDSRSSDKQRRHGGAFNPDDW
jgi:hypothetical protein